MAEPYPCDDEGDGGMEELSGDLECHGRKGRCGIPRGAVRPREGAKDRVPRGRNGDDRGRLDPGRRLGRRSTNGKVSERTRLGPWRRVLSSAWSGRSLQLSKGRERLASRYCCWWGSTPVPVLVGGSHCASLAAPQFARHSGASSQADGGVGVGWEGW